MDHQITGKKQFSPDILFSIRYPTWSVPTVLSPDGRWLAITLQSPTNFSLADHGFTAHGVLRCFPGSSVVILDIQTGETINPFPEGSTSLSPSWSPDGNRLAAYVQHQGHVCLGVWNRDDSSCSIFSHITARPNIGFEFPRWTPNSRQVVMRTYRMPQQSENELSVKVYHNYDSGQTSSSNMMSHWLGDLSLVDVVTGEVEVLSSDWDLSAWKVSPDGKSVAACRRRRFNAVTFDVHCELVVIPLDGSETKVITEEFLGNEWANGFSWSPDSQWLAYATGGRDERGRIFVVPSDGSVAPHDLTADLDVNFSDSFRSPCWSADSQRIIRQVGSDIWTFSIDGTSKQKITPELSESTRFSFTVSAINRDLLVLDENAVSIYFTDTSTGRSGITLVDLATGKVSSAVHLPDKLDAVDAGMERGASADGKVCYDFLESPTHTPQLWKLDMETGVSSCIWAFNPTLEDVAFGEKRLIDWKAPDGRELKAALLLPPGYRDGERVPLIVEVYAGGHLSRMLNAVCRVGLTMNPHLLAAQGYAVLYPDLPIKDQQAVRKEVSGLVQAVVERTVEMGIADPGRIGVMGQSFGGYTTLCLLTELNIFKAAVANACIADLISMYQHMDESGFCFGEGYCERGQSGLGGNPWGKLDLYIENSPFYHLDHVTTPLLITNGTKDFLHGQAQAAFVGLRRLGKPVELRMYEGEGHAPREWSKNAQEDFYTRVISWFDEHLKC